MKKTLTLIVIASVILISVSCQKEDLPISSAGANNTCPSLKALSNSQTNLPNGSTEKKLQNVVACKACHANKESAVQ